MRCAQASAEWPSAAVILRVPGVPMLWQAIQPVVFMMFSQALVNLDVHRHALVLFWPEKLPSSGMFSIEGGPYRRDTPILSRLADVLGRRHSRKVRAPAPSVVPVDVAKIPVPRPHERRRKRLGECRFYAVKEPTLFSRPSCEKVAASRRGQPRPSTISVQWRSPRQTSRRSPRILQVPRLLLGNGIA